MAELVLCCGKVCSGKTTFSFLLKGEFEYYMFSSDSWMLHFYEETENRELFNIRLNKCEEKILEICEQILNHHNNISLDFGFWKISERERIKSRFEKLGHSVKFVYFPIDFKLQIEYMNQRQADAEKVHYTFDTETVKILNSFFEEPEDRENMITKDEFLNSKRQLTNIST